MSHMIEAPFDLVFSTVSREWHKKAILVEKIDRQVIERILPEIHAGTVSVNLDGESVTVPNAKALVADYRYRTDLGGESGVKPLSIMADAYQTISNGQVLGAVEKAISDFGLDAKITSAGTVRGGRVFFLSLQQDGSSVEVRAGDKWDFVLGLTTSHDGTIAVTAHVSGFRQVCANTVQAALSSSDLKARIYHTKGAVLAMDSLPEVLVAMRNKQADVVEALTYLAGIKCDNAKAQRITKGYVAQTLGAPLKDGRIEFSTRSSNTVDGIVSLYRSGRGNRGETMYDLLNGVTDYYSNGDGTGQSADRLTKTFRSEFGAARDHKSRFMTMLRNPEARERVEEIGAKVVLAN